MRALTAALLLLAGPALAATPAEELAACSVRHAELSKQAVTYNVDPHIKRLIGADLDRARKEEVEGDGDECLEALDHAAKLLEGKF